MKDKIIIILFITYIMFFSIGNLILKDHDISNSERRKLKEFPKLEITSEYISKIDDYLLDHFPFRDTFRCIKANYNYNILNQLDNNNIYLNDNYIFKSNYPTNEKSISNFIEKTNKLKELLTENNNSYIMIIPDKNYYLKEDNFLQIDYNYIYQKVNELNIHDIDIKNLLTLEDFYETDTHWKQENLDKVIKKLNTKMNFNYQTSNYTVNTYSGFYGVYYGESAINRKPETLSYLTNDTINNAEVSYLENPKLKDVYNLNKLDSLDAYEVYLDGASAYIEILNKNNSTNKELIIFRDSFGSSITPLLIPYYSKITVIDNRYIDSTNFLKYIEFNNQDVLFIYSTLMANNSFSLKG